MSGIHKILAPIDFSSCSKRALERAVELAERYFGASIDVLHVWEPPRSFETTPMRVEALRGMEALLAEHEANGIVKFTRLHESGDALPTILEVARRGKYDLIVMGTHGRTGIAHDYLGSVAEKVVRRAPCLVLTVREDKPERATAVLEAVAKGAP
jgi:nucleotide-binding universal stress UspA family protein